MCNKKACNSIALNLSHVKHRNSQLATRNPQPATRNPSSHIKTKLSDQKMSYPKTNEDILQALKNLKLLIQ